MDAINQFCSGILAKVTMPMQPEPFIQEPLVDAVTFTPAILCLREYDADIMAAFTDTMDIDIYHAV